MLTLQLKHITKSKHHFTLQTRTNQLPDLLELSKKIQEEDPEKLLRGLTNSSIPYD